MSFKIKLHPDAVNFLVVLNLETKERLKSGIKTLEIDPFKSRSQADIKKLKGTKKEKISIGYESVITGLFTQWKVIPFLSLK